MTRYPDHGLNAYAKVISDREIEIEVEPDYLLEGAEPCEYSIR